MLINGIFLTLRAHGWNEQLRTESAKPSLNILAPQGATKTLEGTTLLVSCDNVWWHLQIDMSGPQTLTTHVPVLPHCVLQSASRSFAAGDLTKKHSICTWSWCSAKIQVGHICLTPGGWMKIKINNNDFDCMKAEMVKPWVHVDFGQVSIDTHRHP